MVQRRGPPWDLSGNELRVKRRIKPSYSLLPDPAKATLGQRLRFLRRKLGLSIKDLSPKVRLAESAIARIERDEARSQPWVLGRILAFLASSFKEAFPETNGDPYDFLIPPTSFGTWLRNQRLRRGMKQRALAAALGVRPYTVVRYEADLTKPAPAIREKLRKVLKLNGEFERFL